VKTRSSYLQKLSKARTERNPRKAYPRPLSGTRPGRLLGGRASSSSRFLRDFRSSRSSRARGRTRIRRASTARPARAAKEGRHSKAGCASRFVVPAAAGGGENGHGVPLSRPFASDLSDRNFRADQSTVTMHEIVLENQNITLLKD